MSREVRPIKGSAPKDLKIMLDKFDKGVISLIDESLQPQDSAVEAVNLMQVQDGRWSPRWGSAYYGIDWGSTLYGVAEYVSDSNVTHLVGIAGTACKRSDDDGATLDSVSGQSFTAGNLAKFLQIKSYLYIYNGVDNLARYDGTTTLQTYTSRSAPASPSAARTGLSAGSYGAYYQVTTVNEVGETTPTTEFSVSGGVNKLRDNWDTSNYVTVSWSAATGAVRYNVYYSDSTGEEVFLGSTTTTSFVDDGSISPNPYIEPPNDNTTTGPKFADACLSGNRIWGTADPNNLWRVWWGGTGQYQGYFSPFFGGGYIDLELGGRERPKKVIHYRDGKGGAFATVLTSDPEGNGSIWQISLEDTTVGDTTFVIPVAVKIVGSIGTIASLSVINVKDDIVFFNKRGNFSLGSRAQLLNLLSTDEMTVNIRPNIQSLSGSALEKVCAYYYDGKIFESVPYQSTVNNRIMVFDKERKNWNPKAFDFGVQRFLEYTDSSGDTHFLAVPVSGTRLLEISSDIQGDLGEVFDCSYKSPIIHVTRDRVGYAKIKRYWIELGRPRGTINIEFSGTKKKSGFSAQSATSITNLGSGVGWGSVTRGLWSAVGTDSLWSAVEAPQNVAAASVKRFKKLNKLLNNIQFRVTSSSLEQSWVLHMLKAEGFIVPTNPPSTQKL